jgi:polysaccharide export outer membrane protein
MMCVLCLLAFPAAAAQQEVQPNRANEKIEALASLAKAKPAETPIGIGDLVHVDVFDVPELSRDVRVSDTGEIGFPLIPDKITAAGLSTFQLEDKIKHLLVENGLVSNPQVSVFVREQNSQPISVVGAINHPLVYQAVRPTTLLELLALAGGVSDNAGSEILITRMKPSETPEIKAASITNAPIEKDQIITIRLQDLLESGNPVYNIPVYGGDVVKVPPAGIIYVMGAGVAQPGGYVLQAHGEQITVLKAIALARGLTVYAKSNSAVVMRTNPATGQKDPFPVQIKEIEKHKTSDVALLPNDILYIPDSAGKRALARGTEAAISVGTGVALYRSY